MSRRRLSRFRFLGSRLAALVVVSLVAIPAAGASASGQTVVSLTFDNGLTSQYGVRSMLSSHGMHGTFYINSDLAGSNSYYMSWSQIKDLASDGNDIGGQTLDNENLTTVTTAEAQHQVCDDRSALTSQGFSVSSFAYPYGATNATVEGIVKNCGYASARRQGGIYDPTECIGCAYANTIPPADPFNVRGSEWLPQAYTLSDLEGWVSRAQANGGGWVPIVFDDICDSCGASSVSTATLQSFLDWLGQQQNTVEETMRQVQPPADTTPPQTTISCNGGSCSQTFKSSVTVALSASDTSGVSSTHYTTDGSLPTLQSPTYTGPFSVKASETINFRSWDTSGNVETPQSQYIHVTSPLVVSLTFDDGIATQYQVRSMLSSHGMQATFFINSDNVGANSYYLTWSQIHDIASDGNEIGGHTLDHLDLTSLSTSDATHQVCDDRTNLINQGFQVTSFAYPFSKSNPTVDGIVKQCGYVVARKIGGLNDPSDCANCPYAENIPPADPYEVHTPEWFLRPWTLADLQGWITQAEDHGGGWVPLVFHDICDGCANGSISASDLQAFLDWLQARAPQDVVETMRQVVPPTSKTVPPTTTISCGGSSCASWFKGQVSVTLSATDSSSPVTSTHYTTDGSDPSLSSPTYTGPFTVKSTTTVKFRSWDASGDVEPTNTQVIQIDTTAPATTISCAGGSGCTTSWYQSPVSISLRASDGGSGVSSTHYTTDGSTPSLNSPNYSGPFALTVPTTGTVTVKFRSWDVAGNVEASHSQQVRVDATAPTTRILCGGATCNANTSYSRKTKFTFSSSDTGSGVASIHYTTDGSTPTLSSPTYTGGFTLPSGTTTTITFGAWDRAGNVEAPHTQVVHVS